MDCPALDLVTHLCKCHSFLHGRCSSDLPLHPEMSGSDGGVAAHCGQRGMTSGAWGHLYSHSFVEQHDLKSLDFVRRLQEGPN